MNNEGLAKIEKALLGEEATRAVGAVDTPQHHDAEANYPFVDIRTDQPSSVLNRLNELNLLARGEFTPNHNGTHPQLSLNNTIFDGRGGGRGGFLLSFTDLNVPKTYSGL